MPNKRNKGGKKFVFARFEKNVNLSEIMAEVQGFWVGNHKILANRAAFDRSIGLEMRQEAVHGNFNVQPKQRNGGVSYLQAAQQKNTGGNEVMRGQNKTTAGAVGISSFGDRVRSGDRKLDVGDATDFIFKPEKETIEWVKKALICRLKEGVHAEEVVDFLQSRGYFQTRGQSSVN